MTDEILKRLDLLAAKLGTTTTYLWSVLVKQAGIEAIEDVIVSAVWFVVLSISVNVIRKSFKEKDTGMAWVMFICGVLVGAISLAIGMYYLNVSFTEYSNPEYWALKTVLNALKGN